MEDHSNPSNEEKVMLMKKISSRKMPILFGTAIALFASVGLSQEVKAQEQPIRSNIAPRLVNESAIDTSEPQQVRNSLSEETQTNLQNVANSLSNDEVTVTVENLLSDQQLAEIMISGKGADVLNSLQEANAIQVTTDNGEVTSISIDIDDDGSPFFSTVPVETSQGASVENTLSILGSE